MPAKKVLLPLALFLLAGCRAETATLVKHDPGPTPSPARALAEINLAEIGALAPKGRVQDAEYNQSRVVAELLAHGKESIPYLVGKLDDETKVDAHVLDYWHEVRVGDVALMILTDFFTNRSSQNTTIPDVGWDKFLERGDERDLTGEQVLRNYIARHGRLHIKTRWQQLWERYQNTIFWDETERCFNVTKS